ncbi:MAG: acetate--CoA ligase family protein [Thermodesulfovibrionales bacterium]|jgi:acetyl-CoA synthetase (ADP-forming)
MNDTRVPSSPRHEGILSETLKNFLGEGRDKKTLLEHEVKRFLKEIGLPVPNGIYVRRGDVTPSFHHLRFPLVVKVSSSTLSSKTEVNGVRLGLKDEGEVRQAVTDSYLIESAEGVLIEEMAPQGLEVIVGGIVDNQFGPVVMFGLGGVFVELFKDVAFALAPLTRQDAGWLIHQVRAHRLLEGYRGSPPADIETLLTTLVTVSDLLVTGLIKEIDLNPVTLYHKGAMVLDAKMAVIS